MVHLTQQEALSQALNVFINEYRGTTSADWQTFIKGFQACLEMLNENTIGLEETFPFKSKECSDAFDNDLTGMSEEVSTELNKRIANAIYSYPETMEIGNNELGHQ